MKPNTIGSNGGGHLGCGGEQHEPKMGELRKDQRDEWIRERKLESGLKGDELADIECGFSPLGKRAPTNAC